MQHMVVKEDIKVPPFGRYDPALSKMATLEEVAAALQDLRCTEYETIDIGGQPRTFIMRLYRIGDIAVFKVMWYGSNPIATGYPILLPPPPDIEYKKLPGFRGCTNLDYLL